MALISAQILYFWTLNRKKDQILRGERPDDRKEKTGEGELEFKYVY